MMPGNTSLLFCSWGIGIVDVRLCAASMEKTLFNPKFEVFKLTAVAENTHMDTVANKSLDAYPDSDVSESLI